MNLKQIQQKKKNASAERNGDLVRVETLVDWLVFDKERRPKMADNKIVDGMDETAAALDAARQRVLKASDGLVDAENDIAERSRKAIARSKDVANQLTDQLARVNKILGTDFEARLAQLERFTAAIETLARLDKDGKLQALMAAISK